MEMCKRLFEFTSDYEEHVNKREGTCSTKEISGRVLFNLCSVIGGDCSIRAIATCANEAG